MSRRWNLDGLRRKAKESEEMSRRWNLDGLRRKAKESEEMSRRWNLDGLRRKAKESRDATQRSSKERKLTDTRPRLIPWNPLCDGRGEETAARVANCEGGPMSLRDELAQVLGKDLADAALPIIERALATERAATIDEAAALLDKRAEITDSQSFRLMARCIRALPRDRSARRETAQ